MTPEIPEDNPNLVNLRDAWKRLDANYAISRQFGGMAIFKAEDGGQTLVVVASGNSTSPAETVEAYWPYGRSMPPVRVIQYDSGSGEPVLDDENTAFLRTNTMVGSVGWLHDVVDLANPEYVRVREDIKRWYCEENFPAMLARLEAINREDYARWSSSSKAVMGQEGFQDIRMRARASLIGKIGDERFRQIIALINENLVGSQGHPHEEFIVAAAAGEIEDFPPTAVMKDALVTSGGGGINRDFAFQIGFIAESLTAPPAFFEQVMANTIRGDENYRGQTLLVCETIRLLLIKEIKRRLF